MLKFAKVLIACVLLALPVAVVAQLPYDFCQPSASGQMLYYQVVRNQSGVSEGKFVPSVRVTHPEKEWPYYADNKPVGDLKIPATVRHNGVEYRVAEVGENAFYRCEGLTAVETGSLMRIGVQAFCGCTSLVSIDLKEGLLVVDEGAFAYCRGLRSLSIPGSVREMGISAFAMCEGLQKVRMTLPTERLCNALTFLGCPLMQEPKNRKISTEEPSEWAVWERESAQ